MKAKKQHLPSAIPVSETLKTAAVTAGKIAIYILGSLAAAKVMSTPQSLGSEPVKGAKSVAAAKAPKVDGPLEVYESPSPPPPPPGPKGVEINLGRPLRGVQSDAND